MVNLSYPSQDFPAPLPVAVTIPDDWVAIHVPHMLISARAREGHEGFRPSLTVGWQRVSLQADPQDYLDHAARVGATSYENYRLLESQTATGDQVDIVATRQSFESDGDVPTFQETLFVFGPPTTERSRDLFQVTATRHEADEASGELLTEMLNSFTVLNLTAAPEATDSDSG